MYLYHVTKINMAGGGDGGGIKTMIKREKMQHEVLYNELDRLLSR